MKITIKTSDDDYDDDDETGHEGERQCVWIEQTLDGVIMIAIMKMKQQRGDGMDLSVVGQFNILMKSGGGKLKKVRRRRTNLCSWATSG